jgi:hypothetical protein
VDELVVRVGFGIGSRLFVHAQHPRRGCVLCRLTPQFSGPPEAGTLQSRYFHVDALRTRNVAGGASVLTEWNGLPLLERHRLCQIGSGFKSNR